MKKRLVIVISAAILILTTFLTIKFLVARPQEQTLKKEVNQSQVKTTKKKKQKLKTSQEASNVHQLENTTNSGQSKDQSGQENTSQSSTVNIETQAGKASESKGLLTGLQNRDFTLIAGTWKKDLDEVLIISADSSLTLDYKQTDGSISRGQDKIGTGYIREDCYIASITGAGFTVIPAGVKNIHNGVVHDQDSIVIGQSLISDEHAFFKQ